MVFRTHAFCQFSLSAFERIARRTRTMDSHVNRNKSFADQAVALWFREKEGKWRQCPERDHKAKPDLLKLQVQGVFEVSGRKRVSRRRVAGRGSR